MQVTEDILRQIAEAGAMAPSGDNLQPWRFVLNVELSRIDVYRCIKQVNVIYDIHDFSTYIAIGAVVENMVVKSRVLGLVAQVSDVVEDSELVVSVQIVDGEFAQSEDDQQLADAVLRRVTNRNGQIAGTVSKHAMANLTVAAQHACTEAEVKFVDQPVQIRKLAKLLAYTDRLIFSNRYMHEGLYQSLTWSKKEAANSDSLYVGTLSLSLFRLIGLWWLQFWPLVKILRSVGVLWILESLSKRQYRKTASLCLVTMPDNSKQSFFNGGRAFQRLWLEATRLGLSVQPQFGYVAYAQHMQNNGLRLFSRSEAASIMLGLEEFQSLFEVKERTMVMCCRIGHATPVKNISYKRSLDESISVR